MMACALILLPGLVFGALPTPGADGDPQASGFVYVGTVNPFMVPQSLLPPPDVGQLTVTRTSTPDGSARHADIHGSIGDVVHFGPGLMQLFAGIANVDGIVDAGIGSVRLLASSVAETEPLEYGAPFPGALGDNPFFASASVAVGGGFVDVVTVPATADAPNAGDPTAVVLGVFVDCATDGDYPNLTGNASASISNAQGQVLGEVVVHQPPNPVQLSSGCPFGASHPNISVPVLTPLVLHLSVGLSANMGAGHGVGPFYTLAGGAYFVDTPGGHASWNALDTAVPTLNTTAGAGATGSGGRDYSYAAYLAAHAGSTTTTTTTTTTSTFVPPSTLPDCAGFCGDGIAQADCAENCDCPALADMKVDTICDAATSVPTLAPTCARCKGCQIDLSHCSTTSSTISTTISTTTSTSPGETSTTTTLPGACAGMVELRAAVCQLRALLAAPLCSVDPIPKKTDAHLRAGLESTVKLLDVASAHTGKRRARALTKARRRLSRVATAVTKAGAAKRVRTHISPACVATIRPAIGAVEGELPAS
jgi:hypothetical protein